MHTYNVHIFVTIHPTFTCSNPTMRTPEQSMKSVQS